jgi:hypothetical protein
MREGCFNDVDCTVKKKMMWIVIAPSAVEFSIERIFSSPELY